MEHIKKVHRIPWVTPHWELVIEGPVTQEQLEGLDFHPGLVAFRPPAEQKKALLQIAQLPEGRIIIARHDRRIVGYVCFLYPDPIERWGSIKHEHILSLGAIEVAAAYRGVGVARGILEVSFLDPAMEDFLILTTEYYWHWDLKSSGLSIWEYHSMMERMMKRAGFMSYGTDDPEINAHPANCLMARVGKNAPFEALEVFDRLRIRNRLSSQQTHTTTDHSRW